MEKRFHLAKKGDKHFLVHNSNGKHRMISRGTYLSLKREEQGIPRVVLTKQEKQWAKMFVRGTYKNKEVIQKLADRHNVKVTEIEKGIYKNA